MGQPSSECACVQREIDGETVTSVVCPSCVEAKVEPARKTLARVEENLIRVRRSCRKSYFDDTRRAGRLSLETANAESRRLEKLFREVCGVVYGERVAAAEERARLNSVEASVVVGESALARRRAELEAMRSAVLRSKDLLLECLQWKSVLDIFSAFPIGRVLADSKSSRYACGVMAIVGLPLYNSLDALLSGSLSRKACNAAIAAVAQLVVSISDAMRVDLPHPLYPRSGLAQATIDQRPERNGRPEYSYPLSWSETLPRPKSKPTKKEVEKKDTKAGDEDDFFIGLKLLQNDVTHLCFKAGVDPDHLWPAEAVLLNLLRLRDRAASELRKAKALFAVPNTQPSSSAFSHSRLENTISTSRQSDDSRGRPPPPPPSVVERPSPTVRDREPVVLAEAAGKDEEDEDDEDQASAPPPPLSANTRIISQPVAQRRSAIDDDDDDAGSDDWIICPAPLRNRIGREPPHS